MSCVTPAPLSSPGFSRFSQDSDCFFSFTQWDYAGLWERGWGGSDFQLITLEMALCGFYTDSAPSAPARPSPDSRRFWTREVDSHPVSYWYRSSSFRSHARLILFRSTQTKALKSLEQECIFFACVFLVILLVKTDVFWDYLN